MNKLVFQVFVALGLVLGTAGFVDVRAQEHPWTVIEYPVGEEVVVDLLPGKSVSDAKGTAKVTRGTDETTLRLEISGIAGDTDEYHLYAVDQKGMVTALGTVKINDGGGSLNTSTPLHKFMLVLSSEADLKTILEETPVLLASALPSGFAPMPRETTAEVTETDPKTAEPSPYRAPMLDISTLKLGRETSLRVKVVSGIAAAKAGASVRRLKGGTTQITRRLQSLKGSANHPQYVLWAISSDENYLRLGEATPTGRNQAKIEAKAALDDFGLFVTVEHSQGETPAGELVAKVWR